MPTYVVMRDDESWSSIAAAQCVSLDVLLEWNGMSPDASNPPPYAGESVAIPDPIVACVAPGNDNTVHTSDADLLEHALEQLATQAENFARVCITEVRVRTNYLARIARMSDDIRGAAQRGEMTYEDGARIANQLRNDILAESRAASTAIGRAVAEAKKSQGRTLEWLIDKTLKERFGGRSLSDLSAAERQSLFDSIIEASGRGSRDIAAAIPKIRIAGRACLIITIAISAYNIWTADNKVRATMHETLVLGGGFAGGAAAGAVAGLACGPGAPVCVTVFFFIGGIAGSLAGEVVDSALDDQLNELAQWIDPDAPPDAVTKARAEAAAAPPDPGSDDPADGGVVGSPDDADVE